MALKLYMKQQPVFNPQGQTVIYTGLSPQTLQAQFNVPLPVSRQWPSYGSFIDATSYVSDISKLQLTWQADKDTSIAGGEYQNKRSASGTLTFEAEAFQLIKAWLLDDVSASLNAVLVNIHDTDCDIWYNDYSFNAADIRYCEDVECVFQINLRQKEDPIQCIRNTVIYDNWQGWFQEFSTKQHPRFSYCNEQRPNGMMVMLWWFTGTMVAQILPLLFLIAGLVNGLLFVVNIIIGVIQFLGGVPNPNFQQIKYIDPQDFLDSFAQYYVETAGCGREHPAPLIRDYITNVCDKCGVEVNAETAPLFFAQYITIETASRGVITSENHHYRACLFSAIQSRGIRRFRTLGIIGQTPNSSTWFIPGNVPVWSLTTMLDELKPLYNMEWQVRNNKLYIQRKDFFTQGDYVYDFSNGSPDRNKILNGICYDWNEIKYPAYTTGLYTDDAADKPGNEAKGYYNDIVDFGKTAVNPNFEGELTKYARFGATKFRLDGASEDYLYDAMQVVVNGSFLTPFLAGLMFDFVGDYIQRYADYGVLLDGETTTLPKVIIWDGQSYGNAKAARPYAAHDNAATVGLTIPPINPKYNGDGHRWQDRHPPQTFVRGSGLTLPPNQPGFYLVTDFFGAREIKQPAQLCNYFMYFAQDFQDTMWDWFHWIDDPNTNPRLNMEWTVKIDACCEDLNKLKVYNSGQDVQLNGKVKLPTNFYTEGKITEITVNYDVENEFGQYIEIKGVV